MSKMPKPRDESPLASAASTTQTVPRRARSPSLDDLAARGPAQAELLRVLRLAVPDADACRDVVSLALRSAGSEELPSHPVAVLHFVRGHLAPHLTEVIGPTLVAALIEDLSSELDRVDPASDGPGPSSGAQRRGAGDQAVLGRLSFPRLRRSLANLVRTASKRLAAVVSPAPSGDGDGGPVRIVFVHPDRLARAEIARAFVRSQFDVEAFDSMRAAAGRTWPRGERLIVVTSIEGDELDAPLGVLAGASPDLRVLAWTDAPAGEVEPRVRAAGIAHFSVASRTASPPEIINAVRRLLRSAGPTRSS